MKLKILELIEYFHADQTQNNNTPFSSEDYEEAIAELEKVILDYYLAKGYQIGVGDWRFSVQINSDYNLTSWNTTLLENDIIYFNIISATTITKLNLIIKTINF